MNEIKNKEKNNGFKSEKDLPIHEQSFERRFFIASNHLQSVLRCEASAHNYKYCQIQPILKERSYLYGQGIVFKQRTVFCKESYKNILVTTLYDVFDDYREKDKISMKIHNPKINEHTENKDKNLNKQFGASLTYYRRYQLYVILGIQPEDDKDGES